ncbi:hypothetical protein AGMMS49982_08010 [Bacteroidia bacterium]|nr:hypothetical protein AGMMS49982_08010 [Bacteroidia bacterium]
MATKAAKATKAVKVEHGETETYSLGKGRLTDFWEKYPNGTLIVYDRKAVNK